MDRRGISPVIATVIIVAVAIAVAIAVAFWMTGIVGLFTGFEQVQITAAYAPDTSTIRLRVKNTGTTAATVDEIFINGRPHSDMNATVSPSLPITLSPGQELDITISLTGFSSGQSVEVKIHTASGKEYPKLVVLP